MELHLAPIQGHTDPAYRYFFNKNFKGINKFYTPFIRLERGEIRIKDLKDLESEFNSEIELVPQIIFKDETELKKLIYEVEKRGYNKIDLNLGCPFPLQTSRGRGAAVIGKKELVENIAKTIENYSDISFSIKMRLGYKESDEWKHIADIINEMKIEHLTIHPRRAIDQYRGEVNIQSFEEFYNTIKKPLIYNGDLREIEDIKRIKENYPSLKGIMLGRGILSRPVLAEEYLRGAAYDKDERLNRMLDLHNQLLSYYEDVLCGESQVLSKIKPFWEYSEEEIGKKAYKAIKKSINMAKYRSAITLIR